MSPPPKKELWVFVSFPKVVTDVFMFRHLKNVCWLSSVSCTQGVLTDCLVCVVNESVHWLFDGVLQWDWRMWIHVFLFWFLMSVYWLCSVKCTKRVLTDCLICVVLEGCSLIHWGYCAMKLKQCLQILSFMVPEECLLIVQAVLYLKKLNWSNIVTKCLLHPKEISSFFAFSKIVMIFLMWRYLKSVYWLSSVSCTQGVLTDCLVCVVPEGCSLIIWWCCTMRLKNVNTFFLFWFLKSVCWLSKLYCTWRRLIDQI